MWIKNTSDFKFWNFSRLFSCLTYNFNIDWAYVIYIQAQKKKKSSKPRFFS